MFTKIKNKSCCKTHILSKTEKHRKIKKGKLNNKRIWEGFFFHWSNKVSFWKMSKVKLRHSQNVGFNVLFFFVVPLHLCFFFLYRHISVEQLPTQKQLFFYVFFEREQKAWLGALSEVKYWQRKKSRVSFLQKRNKIRKEKVKIKGFFS